MNRKSPHYVHFSDPFDDWYYNAWYAPFWPLPVFGIFFGVIYGSVKLVMWLV